MGQPKKFTTKEERLIVRKIKANPRLSAPKMVQEVLIKCKKKVSASTVRVRRTIKTKGYNGRVTQKKPFINMRNRQILIKFAREHKNKDETWWDDVIFADESKYNLFGLDGRVMVWRKPNEELKSRHTKLTVKHGGGHIMV